MVMNYMFTKSGIRLLNEGGRKDKVRLPNGRKIGLASREGADDFVDTVATDFISTNLTATDDENLDAAYTMMIYVIGYASPEKIAAGFPESELRCFVEHTRDTLQILSSDRNWLLSGQVPMRHKAFLHIVSLFLQHPSFVKIFLSDGGMEAVANFYASRKKNDTPCHRVAHLIIEMAKNAAGVLANREFLTRNSDLDNCDIFEKGFGTLEKAGLLGQLIRCVPVDTDNSLSITSSLQMCLQLVKTKLKSGTRTGDILDAVIAGKDGPISENAKSALAQLQTLARLCNNNYIYDTRWDAPKICSHCKETETLDGAKHMKCQRCKSAYYCSRDCQVAHWKSHKKMCKEMSSSHFSLSAAKTSITVKWSFMQSNYFDIMKEIYKKTQEYNVLKKELFVEIDFFGDAPALRNQIKVWLTSDFFDESVLVDAPQWFSSDDQKAAYLPLLREAYGQATSDDLLTACRHGSGNMAIQNLCNRNQLLSDEAVESIGREDYVRMVACLGQDITNRYFDNRSGLD
jgi:hypothetical protein